MSDITKPRGRGNYQGECRLNYNILEQWDGHKWQRVPGVIHPETAPGWPHAKIHFDVEDALHPDIDPVDSAFRPRERR